MPGVVRPWTQRQPNLAHNLCPHVQGDGCVLPFCKRQSRPVVGRAIHFVFLPSVDEISKRVLNPLEHVPRFLLCPVKGILDTLFDTAERTASFSLVVIVFYVLHGRTREHSFGSLHSAASRADVYRADRMRRSI